MYRVEKRDGRIVDFELPKIANAMKKMADDIINGELKINFIFENYEQEHKNEE